MKMKNCLIKENAEKAFGRQLTDDEFHLLRNVWGILYPDDAERLINRLAYKDGLLSLIGDLFRKLVETSDERDSFRVDAEDLKALLKLSGETGSAFYKLWKEEELTEEDKRNIFYRILELDPEY